MVKFCCPPLSVATSSLALLRTVTMPSNTWVWVSVLPGRLSRTIALLQQAALFFGKSRQTIPQREVAFLVRLAGRHIGEQPEQFIIEQMGVALAVTQEGQGLEIRALDRPRAEIPYRFLVRVLPPKHQIGLSSSNARGGRGGG